MFRKDKSIPCSDAVAPFSSAYSPEKVKRILSPKFWKLAINEYDLSRDRSLPTY
jgi:hypothetical protein